MSGRMHAVRSRRALAPLLIILGLIIVGLLTQLSGARHPIATAETRFVERDASGLQIVPASCPSNPHGAGTLEYVAIGLGMLNAQDDCTGGCTLTASATSVKPGTPVTLTWNISPFYSVSDPSPLTGTGQISPGVGPATPPTGTVVVTPSLTTTYTLYGYYNSFPTAWFPGLAGAGGGSYTLGTYQCQVQVTVQDKCADGSEPPCAQSQCIQSCTCLDATTIECTNADCTQTTSQCTASCSNNSCDSTGPTITTWRVAPVLVPIAGKTHITWQAINVASCTVTGTNGDSWTPTLANPNLSGEFDSQNPIMGQTIYTIDCVSNPVTGGPVGLGVLPGQVQHVTRSTTVNVIPAFKER